jgi:CBS domain-containing protein
VIGHHQALPANETRMRSGNFRSMPVIEEGSVVGIITDRDCGRTRATTSTPK